MPRFLFFKQPQPRAHYVAGAAVAVPGNLRLDNDAEMAIEGKGRILGHRGSEADHTKYW